MKREENSTKRAGVKHLTWEDRNNMQALIRKKWPFKRTPCWAQLGRDMKRSARSARNEYLRGKVTLLGRGLEAYETYSAEKGQQEAERRHANKGAPMKITNARIPRKRIREIEDEINNMERAILGWKSALEKRKEMLNENAA